MVKIRLARHGSKKNPIYRVVIADERCCRNGRFIERVGWYNPLVEQNNLLMNLERIDYWLKNGAQATDTVQNLIRRARKTPASA